MTTRSDVFTIWVIAESVQDLDRDGKFDWVYEQKWRWYPSGANPAVAPPNISQTWWTSNVVLTAISNIQTRTELTSGDGDSDEYMDRLRGRCRIQAVVQREMDPGPDGLWGTGDEPAPQYRVLYTRYWPD